MIEIQNLLFPLSVILAAVLAKFIYFEVFTGTNEPLSFYIGNGIVAAILMSLIAGEVGIKSEMAIVSPRTLPSRVVALVSLSFLLLLCLFYLLKISDNFSRGWFLVWYVLSVALVLASRFTLLVWARRLTVEGRLFQRIAIYGDLDLASRVRNRLREEEPDALVAGIFGDGRREGSSSHLGGLAELVQAAQNGQCDRIIVALPQSDGEKLSELTATLDMLPVEVQLCPDAMTVPCPIHSAHQTGGLVLLDLQRPPLTARGILVKAAMDYLMGAIALLLALPAMALIAIVIKFDSRGPVLFIQSRHGYNHRVVRVMKFRTMYVAEDGPAVTQAVRGDKRVTRVGRFLRRTSLDELPQIFNVMRGELSLVGPRPHAVAHNESYTQILSSYASRHKVKPGITGWAQVNGFRGETKTPDAMQKRVDLDLYYIKHWSPWLDFQILLRTVLVPFMDANAY